MNKKLGLILFLAFFLPVVFFHYRDFIDPGKSLFLTVFDDPAPRWSFYPWLVESARQIKRDRFPLWCGLEGAGMPLLANYQSTPFNPFNLIFELFPNLKLLDLLLVLKLVLLGVFTFVFLLELGLSPLSAGASALTICFSGYVSKTINQVNINTEIFLPAGLLVVERIFNNRFSLLKFILLTLITAMALLGGNPEAGFYYLLFLALYSLVRAGFSHKRELLLIGLSIFPALFICSAQFLSFIEYLGYGWHIHNTYLHTIGKPALRWFYSLFFPWLFGPSLSHPQQLFHLSYLGLVPVFLALFSLVRIRSLSRQGIFFCVYALVFLAVIYRIKPLDYINYLPLMNRIASVKFAYFGVCFCLSALAGFGLEQFLKKNIRGKQFAISFGIVSSLSILSLLLAYSFRLNPSASIFRGAWLMPMLLILLAGGIALYGIIFEEIKLSGALLVFLTLINLLHLYPGLRPNSRINPESWRYKTQKFPPFLMPVVNNPGRFIALHGIFHHNLNLIYRLNDLRVFEGIYPESYVRAIAEIEGFNMEDAVEQFFQHGWSFDISAKNLSHPLLSQLSVNYLLSPREISVQSWNLISQKDSYYIYKNPNALPRTRIQPGNTSQGIGFSRANLEMDQTDFLKVRVRTNQPAELVLADQYAPGWRAFSLPNKTERKISPEAILLRKVPIQPGDDYIIFIYQPWGFRIGLFFSLVSICALVSALIFQQILRLFSRRLAIRA